MKRPVIKDKHTFKKFNLKPLEGEPIEVKVRRILDENEPLTDGAPIIFTDKKDGVRPEFNIRTDKWQVAMDAMDKVSSYEASEYAKTRENPDAEELTKNKKKESDVTAQSTDSTGNDNSAN